jgi:hypothetical protein
LPDVECVAKSLTTPHLFPMARPRGWALKHGLAPGLRLGLGYQIVEQHMVEISVSLTVRLVQQDLRPGALDSVDGPMAAIDDHTVVRPERPLLGGRFWLLGDWLRSVIRHCSP